MFLAAWKRPLMRRFLEDGLSYNHGHVKRDFEDAYNTIIRGAILNCTHQYILRHNYVCAFMLRSTKSSVNGKPLTEVKLNLIEGGRSARTPSRIYNLAYSCTSSLSV
ncbi:hypothetical protein GJ496_009253 [Pomphorhynchus laevis]|nr:hypothetical protein GJ496_009253 [Pomphorhynchus laevis]